MLLGINIVKNLCSIFLLTFSCWAQPMDLGQLGGRSNWEIHSDQAKLLHFGVCVCAGTALLYCAARCPVGDKAQQKKETQKVESPSMTRGKAGTPISDFLKPENSGLKLNTCMKKVKSAPQLAHHHKSD